MEAQPIEVLVWNVRGLNSPARRSTIVEVVGAASPDIVCFQDSKMEVVMPRIVRQCMGRKFEDFLYLSAHETGGGIVLVWDDTRVSVSNPYYRQHALTALVRPHGGA